MDRNQSAGGAYQGIGLLATRELIYHPAGRGMRGLTKLEFWIGENAEGGRAGQEGSPVPVRAVLLCVVLGQRHGQAARATIPLAEAEA